MIKQRPIKFELEIFCTFHFSLNRLIFVQLSLSINYSKNLICNIPRFPPSEPKMPHIRALKLRFFMRCKQDRIEVSFTLHDCYVSVDAAFLDQAGVMYEIKNTLFRVSFFERRFVDWCDNLFKTF